MMRALQVALLIMFFVGGLAQAQPGKAALPMQPAAASGLKSASKDASNSKPDTLVPSAPVTTLLNSDAPIDSLLNEELIRTLRDPFQLPAILLVKKEHPKTDLELFALKDFKLNGVITGPKKTRAMVTTPNNKVFFVRVGDHIGLRDGTITSIKADGVRVMEYAADEHGKRVPDAYEMTIGGDLLPLTKPKEE